MRTPGRGSLNYLEINLLLAELDLTGAVLKDFYQPRPERLIIALQHRGRRTALAFVMSQTACRFHLYTGPLKKAPARQRFVSFLYARAADSRLGGVEHVADERILKITLRKNETTSYLWVRLWSSAPNIIFTDATGLIGDALFRRPKKGEVSGGYYHPEKDFQKSPPRPLNLRASSGFPRPAAFVVRDFGAGRGSSLHERVEAFFENNEATERETGLREKLIVQLEVEEKKTVKSLSAVERWLSENADYERNKQCGDLILSSLSSIKAGAAWFEGRDYFHGNTPIDIALDPKLSAAQNAEQYYQRYKKTKAAYEHRARERSELDLRLKHLRARISEVGLLDDASRLEELAGKIFKKKPARTAKDLPGLVFYSQGFTILVGRTAKENEELFRRHVRGNDYWMHARDYPGASVFIKSGKVNSPPLEVLLDAGHLALFYSKGKNSSLGDLYYTRVKYLKKAKGEKTGLFLPTQEKNLTIRLDASRLERLKNPSDTII